MKNLKKHLKILSALSLASSDTRKDTFISVVIRTLYEFGGCEKEELSSYIIEQFGFEPYPSELDEVVKSLLEENRIHKEKKKISLTIEERQKIDNQDIEIRDKEKARYQNFKNFLADELGIELEGQQIKTLWTTFLEYLYNSFFEYGEDALRTLHPHILDVDNNGYYENILASILEKIEKPEQRKIFKEIIERFPDFASNEDINFLNELAQKTLSFSSLGFEPEVAKSTIEHDIVDWVLYLDTNVLFSLLDLHSHPENDSCKALIQLIRDNQEQIKIKLRYSDITFKELGYKKSDFDLLDDKLTDNSINALLKSDRLDGFSKKFYENLLENREGTIQPSVAIELSQSTLKRKTIQISRNAKRIENLGEDYLAGKVQDFFAYINNINAVRMEYCNEKNIPFHPIEKSDAQANHDITLRELLIDSRRKINKGEEISLNSIKFFSLTLDDLLVRFDRSQLRDYNDEKSFPVFFKPSFLLNRLVRVLPIKTDDYKKAFIKAVTSKGFHKETSKSRDVLKIVNYLKSQGVDNERVVYNIISQDIFLEKYHDKQNEDNFNQGEFIQSELNREFGEFRDKLENTEEAISKLTEKADAKVSENQMLNKRKKTLESEIRHYESALKEMNKRVKQLEKQKPIESEQQSINFEAAEANTKAQKEREKANDLKQKLIQEIDGQIEREILNSLKSWQKKIWWNLFWVIPCLVIALLVIIPNDFVAITEQANRFTIGAIITSPVLLIFLRLVFLRYWNEGNKAKRRENHVLSERLKAKRKEIED